MTVQWDIFFTQKQKLLEKGHFKDLQTNINLYMFRYEFVSKKRFFDERSGFNFFSPENAVKMSLKA